MNALAKETVGKYINTHFVSAFQKVASFQIAGGQKQGGNVASYFCTPDGLVLHAIAGPVDEQTFLREARWAVETFNLAQLEAGSTAAKMRPVFQKAHMERLRSQHGWHINHVKTPASVNAHMLGMLLEQNRHRGLGNQAQVHLLLAVVPLPRLELIYQVVFEKILNEKVSTNPVAVAGR